jgi:hypothetical protein
MRALTTRPRVCASSTHDYFSAGATRWGTEAKGAYEYADKEYVGFFDHGEGEMNQCADCHSVHGLEVDEEACAECHEELEDGLALQDIRYNFTDFDGDGDDEEGLYYEIEHMREELYAAMQAYSAEEVGRCCAVRRQRLSLLLCRPATATERQTKRR